MFYHFSQNNSGGYFINNEKYGISEDVIIEANTAKEAFQKLESLEAFVPNLFSYCSCCGERWSDWLSDSDGKETPHIYGTPVELQEKDTYRERAFVHYADGTIKKFIHKS